MIQHPEHIESASSKFTVMLHDGYKTICDNCNVYLYSHRILSIAPEGLDSEMLLYPAEEKFHLPSLLVEHGHISGQIIISFVEDIERVRLIWNVIHIVYVMDIGLRNMNILRYLGDYIKKGVNLYSAFGLPETGSFVQTQTQIFCSGVKGVELSVQNELAVYPLGLGQCYRVISEFFEKPVIPVSICIFQSTSVNDALAKTEVVTLILMGCNNAYQFPEAVTSRQLSEHRQQEQVSARHGLGPLICIVTLHHLIKLFLWQEFHELTEYVFSAIHVCLSQFQAAMIRNQFKSFSLKIAAN